MPVEGPEVVRPRPRIEGLADLIFGLALSVGSLALVSHLPVNSAQLTSDILTFGFTFLILISVWFDYTRILSVMPVEDRRTNSLNSLLLFCVSLEPFLFIVVNSQPDRSGFFQTVSTVYAIDLGVMMGVLAAFSLSLAYDRSIRLHPSVRDGFRGEAGTRGFIAAFFFLSALPVFAEPALFVFNEPLRIWMWIVPMVLAVGARRLHPHFPDQAPRRPTSDAPPGQGAGADGHAAR